MLFANLKYCDFQLSSLDYKKDKERSILKELASSSVIPKSSPGVRICFQSTEVLSKSFQKIVSSLAAKDIGAATELISNINLFSQNQKQCFPYVREFQELSLTLIEILSQADLAPLLLESLKLFYNLSILNYDYGSTLLSNRIVPLLKDTLEERQSTTMYTYALANLTALVKYRSADRDKLMSDIPPQIIMRRSREKSLIPAIVKVLSSYANFHMTEEQFYQIASSVSFFFSQLDDISMKKHILLILARLSDQPSLFLAHFQYNQILFSKLQDFLTSDNIMVLRYTLDIQFNLIQETQFQIDNDLFLDYSNCANNIDNYVSRRALDILNFAYENELFANDMRNEFIDLAINLAENGTKEMKLSASTVLLKLLIEDPNICQKYLNDGRLISVILVILDFEDDLIIWASLSLLSVIFHNDSIAGLSQRSIEKFKNDGGFDLIEEFTNHENTDISQIAVDLMGFK